MVGVIASLALLIAREAFLPAAHVDWIAGGAALAAFVAAWRFKVGALWLVAAGAALGLLRMWSGL